MYGSKTSGVTSSQTFGGAAMRRKALLQDNSWIKHKEEEEIGVDDLNYGRDVLGGITPNVTESNPANVQESNTTTLSTSVTSITKRFTESQDAPNKYTTPATKPPVPQKKTTTPQSNIFSARVFSGASSGEKVLSPVKKSMDEKLPVSDAVKAFPDSTERKYEIPLSPSSTTDVSVSSTERNYEIPLSPSSTSNVSVRKTTETITNPDIPYSSITSRTESYSKILDQSTDRNYEIPLSPSSTSNISIRKTSETITSPEIPYSSFTSRTETYSKILEQSSQRSTWDTSYNSSPQVKSNIIERNYEIPLSPSSTSNVSVRKTSETITSPEIPYSSFTSRTETYSKTLEQSPQRSSWDMSYNSSPQINTMTTVNPGPQTLNAPMSPAPLASPNRIVGKRDLCSFCAKNITEGERIILDDLQIFSHTYCFKCDMCYQALGNLAAGDTLWVHRGRVTCDHCYYKTKDKWYR